MLSLCFTFSLSLPLSLSLFLSSSFTVFLCSPPSYSHVVAEPFFSLSFYRSLSVSIYPLSLFISVALSPSLSFVPLSFHTPFLFPPLPLCLSRSLFLSISVCLSASISLFLYLSLYHINFLLLSCLDVSGPFRSCEKLRLTTLKNKFERCDSFNFVITISNNHIKIEYQW